MTNFTIYNENNAPDGSRALLHNSRAGFGMIPNFHGVMAEAPGLLEAYKTTHELFMHSSFSAEEKTVVWQTINVENACHYCVPVHTLIANGMGVDAEITKALRNRTPLPTPRLDALRIFTLGIIRKRGNISEAAVDTFIAAGFTHRQVLEVILGYAQKVMSNYTNHVADTPIDSAFLPFEWTV